MGRRAKGTNRKAIDDESSTRARHRDPTVEAHLNKQPIQRMYAPILVDAMQRAFAIALPHTGPNIASPIDRFRKYHGKESDLVEQVLRERIWGFPKAVFDALAKHRFVAVRAARKVSKTQTGAEAVLAYSLSHETITLTTAPGGRQVKEQMWERMAGIWQRAKAYDPSLPGELSTNRFAIGPEHYALGMSTNTADRFHGWHAGVIVPDDPDANLSTTDLEELQETMKRVGNKRMFIVIDEAPGVPRQIYHAIEGSFSGSNVYVLLLGNPTLSQYDDHPFVGAFKNGSRYYRIKVSAVPDPGDPVPYDEAFIAPNWLVDPKWVEQQRLEWGEGSPMWNAYVLGRFVADSRDFQFITATMMEANADREPPLPTSVHQYHLGVDVAASEKGDESVASLWVGDFLAAQHSWRTADLMATAGLILKLMRVWGLDDGATITPIPPQNVHIDNTGIGKGLVDRLRQMGHWVDAVDFGMKARYMQRDLTGSMLFRDQKSELLWILRRRLEEGKACIPRKYMKIWEQSGWYTYELRRTADGTSIDVRESKDVIREEFGRSPDQLESALIGLSRGGSLAGSIRVVDEFY